MNKITKITGLTQIDFLKKWVAALESGKIKRTTGQLKGEGHNGVNGMCCLGVACDILSQQKYGKWDCNNNFIVNSKSTHGMPHLEIQKFIENDTNLDCDDLAEKNDDGRTFKKTAAVIRTAIKRLEKQK